MLQVQKHYFLRHCTRQTFWNHTESDLKACWKQSQLLISIDDNWNIVDIKFCSLVDINFEIKLFHIWYQFEMNWITNLRPQATNQLMKTQTISRNLLNFLREKNCGKESEILAENKGQNRDSDLTHQSGALSLHLGIKFCHSLVSLFLTSTSNQVFCFTVDIIWCTEFVIQSCFQFDINWNPNFPAKISSGWFTVEWTVISKLISTKEQICSQFDFKKFVGHGVTLLVFIIHLHLIRFIIKLLKLFHFYSTYFGKVEEQGALGKI